MRPRVPITLGVGLFLIALGAVSAVTSGHGLLGGCVPIVLGCSLAYVGWVGTRGALIIFGHACLVMGCVAITWGLYDLEAGKPTLLDILTRPLFWGMISFAAGFCVNYHAFCQCVRKLGKNEEI